MRYNPSRFYQRVIALCLSRKALLALVTTTGVVHAARFSCVEGLAARTTRQLQVSHLISSASLDLVEPPVRKIGCTMRLRSALRAVQLCQSHAHAAPLASGQVSSFESFPAFHTCVPVAADSKAVKKGKERQASASSQLAEILPQNPAPPQRTAEELQDAENRVKEYSRARMKELRAHQAMQKKRTQLRCVFILK